MDLQLRDRTAIVTGASQGIGKATAIGLAAQGVRVALVARRRPLLEDIAAGIVAAGGPAPHIIEADLYQETVVERIVQSARTAFGHVDIVVNAGGGSRPLDFDAGPDLWLEGMTLNFFRLRELTQALIPGMRERRWGRVVNITGTSEPKILNAAFSAKAAVHIWAKGLSRLVAADNVTVNCLQPGRIHSEQMTLRYPTIESELEFARHEIPAGRFGEAEELANVAIFLCSPRAAYVTGTVIPVDGGMSRHAF
ncbi:SDR family oxidoreductase [Pigmentiphaga kullae]|uniref:3-oxoacyl-[acyl-carrier protein] reductase n=1 Tax=Pigmentiphaga kullae TaxID=151784 RepID=A0A4V2F2D8_9BURK|nr:SDR family oxidoreductase [Pigmentiphaga kullae]RZS77182.1 3-oxoacyl-[acyl-carrier protein] reductase [Pigmentiphaga kullae]